MRTRLLLPRRRASLVRASVRSRAPWAALTVVLAVFTLWPLWRLQSRAIADGASGIRRVAQLRGIGATIRNTVLLGVGSVLVAVTCGTILALCAASLTPRARRIIGVFPLMPLVVPMAAVVSGWAFLLSPSVGYVNVLLRRLPFVSDRGQGPINIYSVPWIVLITGFALTSFVFVFVDTGLRNLGREHELAAAACGASRLRTLRTITLPLLRPSITYSAATVLLLGLGQFTAPLLLGARDGINVLTTEMYFVRERYPVDYALGAGLGTPLLLVGIAVVIGQRYMIGNQSRFVAPQTRDYGSRSRSSRIAVLVLSLYAVVSTLLPLLALVFVAFSPYWSGKLDFGALTTRNLESVLNNPRLADAVYGSLRYSLIALMVLLPLGFMAARALQRGSTAGRLGRIAVDAMTTLPLAIPASLFGFGLLFTYSQEPLLLYGTDLVMILTYVTLMIPYVTRYQFATLLTLGETGREAAAACGAGPLRTVRTVVIPLARKGIAASAMMVFVLMAHEFSASLMVRSARTEVMGTVMWDLYVNGRFSEVAVMALLMVGVTIVGVGLALIASGRRVLGSI